MQHITTRSWLLPPEVKQQRFLHSVTKRLPRRMPEMPSWMQSPIARNLAYLLPVAALLVGSGKAPEASLNYAGLNAQKLSVALFPAKSLIRAEDATMEQPNQRYVYRAQTIVTRDPEKLQTLSQKEIAYIFGEPTFSRKDEGVQVWQYKTSQCVIDFYFYDEKKVSYIDMRFKEELVPGTRARGAPASVQEQSGCLTDVVATRSYSASKA